MLLNLGRAVITATMNTGRLLASMASTQLRMAAWSNMMQGHANGVSLALRNALVVGGVGGAAGGFTGFALSAAAWGERMEVAFEKMLGSARAAKEMVEQIQDFAARTQFDVPGVADAVMKLRAMGVQLKDIMPMMQAMADVTAGTGQGQDAFDRIAYAMAQIKAAGFLRGDELRQLSNAMVPATDILSDKLGVSKNKLREMIEAREISSDTAIKALMEGMAERFGGMTDTMLGTLSGKWGKFKDDLFVMFKELGEAIAPFAEIMLEKMSYVVEHLTDKFKDLGNWGKWIADNWEMHMARLALPFEEAMAHMANRWQMFIEMWQQGGQFIRDWFAAVMDWVGEAGMVAMRNLSSFFTAFIDRIWQEIKHPLKKHDFNPRSEPLPEFKGPEVPGFAAAHQRKLAIEAVFDAMRAALDKGLGAAWEKIVNPGGKPLNELIAEDRGKKEDPLEEKKKKDRKVEFLGLEEFWRRRQERTVDPVTAAIKAVGDAQLAVLGESRDHLETIAEKFEPGVSIA